MGTLNTTGLTDLSNITFEQFKILDSIGQNRARTYYLRLKLEAEAANLPNTANYAELAKNVVTGGSLNGIIANLYTQSVAADSGVDFSTSTVAGNENRLRMQYELMRADVLARKDNNVTTNGELGFDATDRIHTTALDSIGLPAKAFSLHTPLTILAEHDPAKAQSLYLSVLPGNGLLDAIKDGFFVGFGSSISSQQELSDILKDYGAQAEWMSNMTDVLQSIVNQSPEAQNSDIPSILETIEQLTNLAGATFDQLADWSDYFKDLPPFNPNDPNSPWFSPTFPGIGSLLPSWLAPVGGLFNDVPALPVPRPSGDPLVLDLDGDGVEVSKLGYGAGASTVYFDMDNDGFAERTAWATGGDGLLTLDKNGNGTIDNQSELFGDTDTLANGFLNLKQYDSNNDNKMTSADAQWDNLRVWVDADGDAVTDAGELRTLSSLNITQINLNANDNTKNDGVIVRRMYDMRLAA